MWKRIRIGMICVLLAMMPPMVLNSSAADNQNPTASPEGARPKGPGIDWNSLKELDLKTAAAIALAENPSLAAAQARVQQAVERVNQAKGTYLPRLDLNYAGSKIWLSGDARETAEIFSRFDPNSSADDPASRYQGGLVASWTMFDGFARKFSNAAARYGQERSVAALSDAKRLLLSAVARAYFVAQLTREDVGIARADEDFNRKQLVEAQARRRVGTGSLSDELNFEIRINDAEAGLIRAEREYETAMYALAALLGMGDAALPPHVNLAPLRTETPAEMETPGAEVLISYALEHRPDIQEASSALRQAGAQVEIARSRFYPTVGLTAGYDGTAGDSLGFEINDFGTSVGLNLTYNLFSGGTDRARVRETEKVVVEQQKNKENIQIAVSADVRESITRLSAAQRQLHLQRRNALLVQRNRELVEKEYNAGQASLVRLNEAQRDLVTAQNRLALALATLRDAWFTLETDTGRILTLLSD